MNKNIFEIKEIITIVMAKIRILEEQEYFDSRIEEDLHLPKYIKDKLKYLDKDLFNLFMDKCLTIAEKVKELKSGELNELNFIHSEISYLAKDILDDFIDE